ncbi:protein FAR1-RELATED SEQUENCE 5-like [Dendrobium catenatum]|uniref:protein FAR1-RELATED SEQUENCE 5-like n=1 Tax=Dendrobium catenatum TaxID=906689 RepID=UPI00109FD427|nr:protein FAR1-RELATED SEQUENCE 5-like [Dendrobium catenatum]
MARAIEVALPHSRHRLCQWHIRKKAPSKVSCYNTNNKVKGLFNKCLSRCDSEEEFENAWAELIIQENLQDHVWLKDLYRIRNKWSTYFNKDCFSMDILSTQRSESTNNVCHGISKPTSSITDCFLGLGKVMRNWRRNEQDEDYRCSQSEIEPSSQPSPAKQYNFTSMPEWLTEDFISQACLSSQASVHQFTRTHKRCTFKKAISNVPEVDDGYH